MEFKYHDGQNQRTPSATPHPLSIVPYVSRRPLQGCEFAPSGFSSNDLVPSVLPMPVSVNVDEAFRQELEKEKIRREREKEKIRKEIIGSEMTLTRRRELKEEVKREMTSMRALGISMQRQERISIQEPVSMSFNRDWQGNNINKFGGPQYTNAQTCRDQVIMQRQEGISIQEPVLMSFNRDWQGNNIKTFGGPQYTNAYTCMDQVIMPAKPDADNYDAKRKVMTPPTVDDGENCSFSLQKKPKQGWSCALCQITTTSEKGLNDHLHGKKHKAEKASMRTQKIGLDSRSDS